MGTIRFELRTSKTDKEGKSPLRIVYQIKQERKFYSIKSKLYSCQWDLKEQQAIYLDKKAAKKAAPEIDYDSLLTAKEVEEFNQELSNYSRQIRSIEKRFELDKIIYNAEMVLNKLKAEHSPKVSTSQPSSILFDFIDRYIRENSATREKGSLKVYTSLKHHLQDYITYTRNKITFDSIDLAFFQSFQNFLIDRHKFFPEFTRGKKVYKSTPLNNITIAKQLSTLKTFLSYAKKHGVKVPEGYHDFKIRREQLEVIALTNKEFETLFYFDLSSNKRLAQVRDVFCLACTTGFRYSDLKQLRSEHVKDDEIRLTVKKTKELLSVPLTPYSRAILDKYKGQYKPLPVISNQKMNDYLKELCELVGINEPIEIVRFRGAERESHIHPKYVLISVHTGRKTFATLSLERGMSAEEVMTITGHKSYASFKRYIEVSEQRKKTVMMKAWGDNISELKLKAM